MRSASTSQREESTLLPQATTGFQSQQSNRSWYNLQRRALKRYLKQDDEIPAQDLVALFRKRTEQRALQSKPSAIG
jgi:hypothetical protein